MQIWRKKVSDVDVRAKSLKRTELFHLKTCEEHILGKICCIQTVKNPKAYFARRFNKAGTFFFCSVFEQNKG